MQHEFRCVHLSIGKSWRAWENQPYNTHIPHYFIGALMVEGMRGTHSYEIILPLSTEVVIMSHG